MKLFMFYSSLGSILEGPDPANLKPLVEQAMPMLIELLKDPSVAVRDTTGNVHYVDLMGFTVKSLLRSTVG